MSTPIDDPELVETLRKHGITSMAGWEEWHEDLDGDIALKEIEAAESESERILNGLEGAIIEALERRLADDFRGVDLFFEAQRFADALVDSPAIKRLFARDD